MEYYRTIWISDIHLGANSCKADNLCSFLKNFECDTLYLVGDIIDGWKLERKWNWPQEHSNVIRRIFTKAKRGTKIIYIIGNHDEFIRSWLTETLSIGHIEFANSADYTDLQNRKWLITHGDLFDQVIRHWKWISMLGDMTYSVLLTMNGTITKARFLLGLDYWSLSQFVKSKTKQAVNFIYKFEETLADYAKKKGYHGVICGHIHTPTIKTINDTVYINDGDWVETCSAVVETHQGEFYLLILGKDNQMQKVKVYK